ncbi:MAG TPA: CsbD family protein [Candidatus Binatia bacterium]|nr:CsbD family protein [Candidatus Binatia bacterium]
MDQDVFAGQWQQMRGTLKAWWGKLADDDFERIGGQTDKLIGLVQERYGYAREQAQQEVERRMKEYGDKMGGRSGSEMPEAAGAMASMTAKAQELGATIASKASEAATAVGETMGSLASVIRDQAPRDGAIATAATAVAGGLKSASSYLHEKDYANLATDLTALVRRYPVQALLVGVGLGYVLARSTRG